MIPAELLYDLEACDDVVGTLLKVEKWKRQRKTTRGPHPCPSTDAGNVLWDACYATVPGFALDERTAWSSEWTAQWERSDQQRREARAGGRETILANPRLGAEWALGHRYFSRIYRMIGKDYLPECPAFVIPRVIEPRRP